jgi:hypothetical protein
MRTRYSYRPLLSPRSIRILYLQPHHDHKADLNCTLDDALIDDLDSSRPCYDALSYVWGERHGSRPLLCEGKAILITPNCELALRHLRRRKKTVKLWVDAICIDQASISEREQQVPLMGDIFRRAFQVTIWLGEGTDESARCFSYLRRLSWIQSLWLLRGVRSILPDVLKRRILAILSK